MKTQSRYWVGKYEKEILVYDAEIQIDKCPHVFLWEKQLGMRKFVRETFRPHISPSKNETANANSIKAYEAWYQEQGTNWKDRELSYYEGQNGLVDEQTLALRHQKYIADLGLEYAGMAQDKQTYHRLATCWSCHSTLDNAINYECVNCHWIICNCGACGCARI